MERREFLQLSAMLAAQTAFTGAKAHTQPAVEKPNVILIIADQWRHGLTKATGYPLAYVAANCHTALANTPNVDPAKIGIVGHSYGGKWSMFASCLYDKFACAVWSDPGIVFNEQNANGAPNKSVVIHALGAEGHHRRDEDGERDSATQPSGETRSRCWRRRA